jgi:N-acetylglutamate synthase-like GNAT family acetyltransferase
MLIRSATPKDYQAIINIMKDLDLYYSGMTTDNFWVAEADDEISGAVQLEPHQDFVYLASLGVKPNKQKQGIGRLLLRKLLPDIVQPVYLYTIIPEYFQQFDFKIDPHPPANLPSKDRYECEDCFTDKCVTMVKYPDAA